jgi:hypothetical protein
MADSDPRSMARLTVRLSEQTLSDIKAIEAAKPRELKRQPSTRVRLVVEDWVERSKPQKRQKATR